MCYLLLLPYGERGWMVDIPYQQVGNATTSTVRKNVSRREHALYRLSVRSLAGDCFYSFLSAGKLTQQYIVDSYVKVESNRLEYLRTHQVKLRAADYAGLLDYLQSVADQQEEEPQQIGRVVILPATFSESPHSMQQHFQDVMAIVAKFGWPDLFVTFTCNPNRPEIVRNKRTWDEVFNRPNLVRRAFELKFKDFLFDVTTAKLFGTAVAYVYAVEFQKRDLPNVHLLLTLADERKPREPDLIDSIVSAEIPDPYADRKFFDLVAKHMVHGPCGEMNPDTKTCTKKFPKPFAERTEVTSGYPRYRRRDTGRTVTVKRANRIYQVDNQFIVPYNRYLLCKYNAHINVEVCQSLQSVKYIHDYVYKGHDIVLFRVDVSSGVYDEKNLF